MHALRPVSGPPDYRGWMTVRPGLDPAVAAVRLAVRAALRGIEPGSTVVVALSGGADSLALAAATAFEAAKAGLRAVAVTIDHGLQEGSADAAAAASAQAQALGLEARIARVEVGPGAGPEAAARTARYAALAAEASALAAVAVLTGHTLDDQAETVLLGLARGSGAASLQGMAPSRGSRRGWTCSGPCSGCGGRPPMTRAQRRDWPRGWTRTTPTLDSRALGCAAGSCLFSKRSWVRGSLRRWPAQPSSCAKTRRAFDEMIEETIEDLVEHAEAGISVSIPALAANPAALRHRIIRYVVAAEFGVSLTRAQTLELARLVTEWTGQGPIDLPGCRAPPSRGATPLNRRRLRLGILLALARTTGLN